MCRVVDQPIEPSLSGLFLLGAQNPPHAYSLVPRRLRRKEFESLFVCPDFLFINCVEPCGSRLARMHFRICRVAPFARPETRAAHQPHFPQLLKPFEINAAPIALWRARRESICVADIVDAISNTIDPSEAKSLVYRLRVRDTRLARTSFVKTDPQFQNPVMVLGKPASEF